MSVNALILLALLFFITSAIGVVTGSNSLITVPVMFQFGIEPKVAVATNMFGLTFMSIGASIPFLRQNLIDTKRLPKLILVTICGSAIGALLVGLIKSDWIPIIVSISMIFVCVFTFIKRDSGVNKEHLVSSKSLIIGYVLAFLLAIYGGLYSGGYVTMLTASFVGFFGMTFTEAIAETKIINVFSSAIATIIFMWQGLIDYRLGVILAVIMFAAAYVGAKTVTRLNDLWLKRIFLTTVLLLAIKTIFDFVK
ncbi:TSUP family transporter [soil metagenome]